MFNFGKNNIQSISSKGNKNIGEDYSSLFLCLY